MVFPVILGSGLRLFPTDAEDKVKLRLVDSTTYTNGVQLNILRPIAWPCPRANVQPTPSGVGCRA